MLGNPPEAPECLRGATGVAEQGHCKQHSGLQRAQARLMLHTMIFVSFWVHGPARDIHVIPPRVSLRMDVAR